MSPAGHMRRRIVAAGVGVFLGLAAGCSRGEPVDYQRVAAEFVGHLAAREYGAAYAMTAREYRQHFDQDQMQAAFEAIVPLSWGVVRPVEISQAMTTWPGKHSTDLGWAYVSIGGPAYSEAVILIVVLEDGAPRVRDVVFGRP